MTSPFLPLLLMLSFSLTAASHTGYLVGGFSPMHQGDLRVAIESLEQIGLDEVILIPLSLDSGSEQLALPLSNEQRQALMTLIVKETKGIKVGESLSLQELLQSSHSHEIKHLILEADQIAKEGLPLALEVLLEGMNLILFSRKDQVWEESLLLSTLASSSTSLENYHPHQVGQILILQSPCFIHISPATLKEKIAKKEDLRGIFSDQQLHELSLIMDPSSGMGRESAL